MKRPRAHKNIFTLHKKLFNVHFVFALSLICLHFNWLVTLPTADAQESIPFTHVIIDDDPPWQTHTKSVGDFDGDGFVDVIAGGAREGYGLYWYQYPNWTKYEIYPPGVGFTTDMQVGDVDNDGDLDAIIPKGYYKGESVWWYENPRPNGDPTVDAWVEHSIGTAGAHDVAVGDVNGDGKLDVVVREGNVTLFLQTTPDSWVQKLVSPRSVEGTALGDIDRDGDLDIVINSYWLENPAPTGDPINDNWVEHLVDAGQPVEVGAHVADINEDGRLDILYSPAESENNHLSWYEAPEDPKSGIWVEHIIDATISYAHTFKTADMDLDGDLDVVTAEMHQSATDEVSVYYNQGDGLSWSQQIVATTGSHNIRLADIGNDGDIDIVGANWHGDTPLEMWQNELNPKLPLNSWQRHVIDAERPWRGLLITSADMDGDNQKDIVTGGWWYKNPGQVAGDWTRNAFGDSLKNMAAVYDFDGDNDMDVLGTGGEGSASNHDFAWARNDGTGTFTLLDNIATGGNGTFLQGVAVDAFQSDGPLEVALSWHDPAEGIQRLTVPEDPSTEIWSWDQLSPTSQGEELSIGDIDNDTDVDLLLGTIWLGNDNTSWTPHTHYDSAAEEPDRNRLADINGDGRLDAVVGYEVSVPAGKLAWYEQGIDINEPWTEHIIATIVGPMSIDVADMDGDGDLDVIAGEHNLTEPSTARLFIFENVDGIGTSWSQYDVYQGDEHHDGAKVVDIDDDGDLDIISIGWTHNRVLIYENKAINNLPNYSLTIGSLTNGSISITQAQPDNMYPEGEILTLTAVADSGYMFNGWTNDLNGNVNPASLTMDGNKTVGASFIKASEVISDDFDDCTLDERWTLIDPVGDAVVEMTGSQARLSVPAGTSHDIWDNMYAAPRLMQPTANSDFELEVKFETAVSQQYQLQGIVVEQDNQNFIRFDFYSDGTNINAFAATFTNGIHQNTSKSVIANGQNLFLRVTRSGNNWSASYSADGGSWTSYASFNNFVLDVSATGVFAGNAGNNAPPHTAVIDYFFNTATPIVPEDGSEKLTINVVGNGQVTADPDGAHACGETVTLTAINDPGWVFSGWSGDLTPSDNPNTSVTITGNHVITATFAEEPQPQYQINLTIVGNGNVETSQDVFYHGDEVALTAIPDPGWEFVKWTGDLTGDIHTKSITISSDLEITATFQKVVALSLSMTVNSVDTSYINETTTITVTTAGFADDIPTITINGLPDGAQFVDNGDGTAVLSWQPAWQDRGAYHLEFMAQNSSASTSETISLQIIAYQIFVPLLTTN